MGKVKITGRGELKKKKGLTAREKPAGEDWAGGEGGKGPESRPDERPDEERQQPTEMGAYNAQATRSGGEETRLSYGKKENTLALVKKWVLRQHDRAIGGDCSARGGWREPNPGCSNEDSRDVGRGKRDECVRFVTSRLDWKK